MLSSKSLDSELQELKTKYLVGSQQTDIFHANLYVPAQGMATQHAPEEEYFDLWERLQSFMAPESTQRVCLIQGTAGAGKSTFNHYLATRLWEDYNGDVPKPIPVFIPLANFHDPTRHNQDFVAELFRRREWPEEIISKARGQLQFVFILDGYDEIEKQDRNFYIDNRLGDWADAKTVITSRPEYLGSGYQSKFYPPGQPQLLQEYWLAPFSTKDITGYITKYVRVITANDPPEAPSRSVEDYQRLVERPELRALISNPFLLKMVMTAQPRTGDLELSRVTLYRSFLDHWLRSAQERLSRIQLPPALAGPFNALCEEGFTEHAEAYCVDFALALYRHQSLEASYSPAARRSKGNALWRGYLTNEDPTKRLLRYSSPLIRVGQSYRFLHKSLRDFAVAFSIWQDEELCAPSALLNEFPIVYDHGIIDFIVEEAMQNQELKSHLRRCVEESKQNAEVANAAANAITILVRAGERFHKYDLRGIRIPGADIRNGWFEGAHLQRAYLSGVRLDRTWLRGADLTGACIDRGEFGEKPYFRMRGASNQLLTCFYTADGDLLVVVADYETHDFTIWSATNRKLLHTFRGHTHSIKCVAFPPNGDYHLLASASWDKTVRLWSPQNQDVQLVQPLKHTRGVHSVVFSPDARFLASRDYNDLVCLWSVTTHNLIHSFSCSASKVCVHSIAFSPDGQTLASAGNRNIELWSTESGELLQTLRGHTRDVTSVDFAPNGQILASVSRDECLNLWSPSYGQLIHSFTAHAASVHTVAFAPDGQMIATASSDNTIRIWSAASRKLVYVFEGNSPLGSFSSLMTFSWNSELIAVHTVDDIVRQWRVPQEGRDSVRIGNGHTREVNDIAFSYDTTLLASASHDRTVRLWSMNPPCMSDLMNVLGPWSTILAVMFAPDPDSIFLVTSDTCGQVHIRLHQCHDQANTRPSHDHMLDTHKHWVRTVAMPPEGNIVASGNDHGEICLWSIPSGTKIHTFKGHTDRIRSVAFSPDAQLLVSGSDNCDMTIRLWSIPRHEILHIYEGHTDRVTHVAFSPDGETVASASRDNTVRLWSVPERTSLHIFKGHTNYVNRVAFSPDGFLLASGSDDKTLRFWSSSSRELILHIDIQAEITALAWAGRTSRSGGLIAIGTLSGEVQFKQVIKKQGYSRENPAVELSWFWSTDYGVHLNVIRARIEGVTGLNPTNIELLKQRGAIGEPVAGRVQEVEEK